MTKPIRKRFGINIIIYEYKRYLIEVHLLSLNAQRDLMFYVSNWPGELALLGLVRCRKKLFDASELKGLFPHSN